MPSACEIAWETGTPGPDRTKYPVWLKPSKQCTFELDGKRVYISPKDEDSLRTFLDSERIVTDLQTAPDGIYTWILYRTGKDIQFSAAAVRSVLEVGTLHLAIAYRTKANTVHGAGELKKEGTTVSINVQSGSFMVEWKLPGGCSLATMGELVLEKVKPFLGSMTIDTTHTDSFITDAMRPTKAEIESYKEKGLIVCEYVEEAVCKKDKGKQCKVGGRRKTHRRGARRRKTRRRM